MDTFTEAEVGSGIPVSILIKGDGEIIFEVLSSVGFVELDRSDSTAVLRWAREALPEVCIQSKLEYFWAEIHEDENYSTRQRLFTAVGLEETRPGLWAASIDEILDACDY